MDNRSLSHTKYRCQYYIVFIPKYRKKCYMVRREKMCADHVHLSVSMPPKLSISSCMGYLKGKSALMMLPAVRAACLTRNGALPTELSSAVSTMRSYVFVRRHAGSRNANRMGERSMILPHLPFRTLSRCPFFRRKFHTVKFCGLNICYHCSKSSLCRIR